MNVHSLWHFRVCFSGDHPPTQNRKKYNVDHEEYRRGIAENDKDLKKAKHALINVWDPVLADELSYLFMKDNLLIESTILDGSSSGITGGKVKFVIYRLFLNCGKLSSNLK